MAEDQQAPKKFFARLFDGVTDVFEEARIMFFGAIFCGWFTIAFCHWLKEMGACAGMLTLIGTSFAAIVAKIAWGKDT